MKKFYNYLLRYHKQGVFYKLKRPSKNLKVGASFALITRGGTKFFIMLFFLFVITGCSRSEENTCGVLPENSNYNIVVGNHLYTFTEHGLIYKGCYIDHEKWKGDVECPVLDKKNKIIYFYQSDASYGLPTGVYKLDINKPDGIPTYVIDGDCPSISPDGNYLTFGGSYVDEVGFTIKMLDIKTGKIIKELVNDACTMVVAWINDHQIIYDSDENRFDKTNRKSRLYVVDVNTLEKEDLQMPGFYTGVGALTPDAKRILLASVKKDVLYNLETRRVDRVISNKHIVSAREMFWLPDESGFIYGRGFWQDRFNPDSVGNLVYYSLNKEKDVMLIGSKFSSAGFVLPPEIELKPVYNRSNRLYFDYPENIKKVCIKPAKKHWF